MKKEKEKEKEKEEEGWAEGSRYHACKYYYCCRHR